MLSGTITLQNFSGDLSLAPVRIQLSQGGNVVTQEIKLTENPGQYALMPIAPGTYTLTFAADKFLRKWKLVQ